MGICGELDNPHVLRWDVDYEAHSQECTEEALRNLDVRLSFDWQLY